MIGMSSQFPEEVQALGKDGQIENLTNLKDGEHSQHFRLPCTITITGVSEKARRFANRKNCAPGEALVEGAHMALSENLYRHPW